MTFAKAIAHVALFVGVLLVSSMAAADEAKGITSSVACSACHTTDAWRSKEKGAAADATGIAFDHSTTGFPLSGQHLHTPCVSCHDGTKQKSIKRACASCHQDAHRGRLAQSCDHCHNATSWRNTKPLEIHRFTRFPLTGMHVLADCTECHRRASEHQWTGAPIDCFACHEKDYRRPTLRPVHVGTATSPPFPRDCSQCHRSLGWAPARFDPGLVSLGNVSVALKTTSVGPGSAPPPNHDLKFPISFGVHRTVACDDCHAQPSVPRMVRCNGCHAHDAVKLTAQHKGMPSSIGAACLSCHPGGVRR